MSLTRYEAQHIMVGPFRFHKTPEGNIWPGVTTITGATANKWMLDRWRQRVGDEEADRISEAGATRGTAMHQAIERFLRGEDPAVEEVGRPYYESARQVFPKITNVHLIEGQVWHPLMYAGSLDLLAQWKGELAVIDWKTSDTPKEEKWLDNYFCQIPSYIAAVNRVYNLRVAKGVIIIGIPNQEPQVKILEGKQLYGYWKKFQSRLEKFYSLPEVKDAMQVLTAA